MTPAERAVPLRGGTVVLSVAEAGQGRPLVYFHSYHERGSWSPFLDRLAARAAVVAPLHPGVRASTGVEAVDDVIDLALVYDELLEALGLPPADLVGHGFGGLIAAEVAALFPGRVRRLALVSPYGLWRDDAPSPDILILPDEELAPTLWRDPESPVARAWRELPDDVEANQAARIESIQRRSAMGKFVWPIPDKGTRRRLHRVRADTLILWGEDDRANPLVYAEEWQRRIKGAAVRLVPGGHMALHERPELVARVLEEFLG